MTSRQVTAIALGTLTLLAAGVFVAMLIAGLSSIHDSGTEVNIFNSNLNQAADVDCGSAWSPKEAELFTDSDCESLTAARDGWAKPGAYVSGGAVALLAIATFVTASSGAERRPQAAPAT